MSTQLDVDYILDSLRVPNPKTDMVGRPDAMTLDDAVSDELSFSNDKWLHRVKSHRKELTDGRAAKLAKELVGAKRRTIWWLEGIGYQGILQLWREDTLGLVAVIRRFEAETGEEFSSSLILDFMESHDSWPTDLDQVYRTHALLHEARWQEAAENADELNLGAVAKAKTIATLAFERAGTLERHRFSKVLPRDDMASGSVINVTISKDGVNSVGVDMAAVATRQQLTAKARVRYGTGRYVDPPGLKDWQRGDLLIPEDKVDDYLMLKWLPVEHGAVVPQSAMEPEEAETAFSSPVVYDASSHSLKMESI